MATKISKNDFNNNNVRIYSYPDEQDVYLALNDDYGTETCLLMVRDNEISISDDYQWQIAKDLYIGSDPRLQMLFSDKDNFFCRKPGEICIQYYTKGCRIYKDYYIGELKRANHCIKYKVCKVA